MEYRAGLPAIFLFFRKSNGHSRSVFCARPCQKSGGGGGGHGREPKMEMGAIYAQNAAPMPHAVRRVSDPPGISKNDIATYARSHNEKKFAFPWQHFPPATHNYSAAIPLPLPGGHLESINVGDPTGSDDIAYFVCPDLV